ncbi:MAG: response regulator transcription factor [Pseudomonadota bacterium]
MSIETPHVVVCDDEADVRETVGEYLTRRGCDVALAQNGAELDCILDARPEMEIVLLDIAMPGEDGLMILRRLRMQRNVAVIMLTAADEPVDRIVGLELGADDYVAKPPDLRELDARIRAVLRRPDHRVTQVAPVDMDTSPPETQELGPFTLDLSAARLTDAVGADVPLTAMEFRLLQVLADNRGRVLSRDTLLAHTHTDLREPQGRAIDNAISRLRHKLRHPDHPNGLIRTVRGLGYVFNPDVD